MVPLLFGRRNAFEGRAGQTVVLSYGEDLNYTIMKRIFLKLFQGLMALLSVAAATSCDDILGSMPCAYGTPTMDYTVMGKVVNQEAEPLKGIKVMPVWDNWLQDPTYTDARGTFAIARKGGVLDRRSDTFYYARLVVEDTSGVYRTDTVYVKMAKIKEGSSWYIGEFEDKDVEIILLK